MTGVREGAVRAAFRNFDYPGNRNNFLGFRLARDK
jgi:formylglycine-generating enzyme required for sulfatase activity